MLTLPISNQSQKDALAMVKAMLPPTYLSKVSLKRKADAEGIGTERETLRLSLDDKNKK
jgi:hypothetical protein